MPIAVLNFTSGNRVQKITYQLDDENERLRVTIFGVGLLYGNGEHILYPFFRALWENKIDHPSKREL